MRGSSTRHWFAHVKPEQAKKIQENNPYLLMRPASISAACGDAGLFLAPVSSTLLDHQQTENMVSAIDTGVPPTSNSTTKGKETSRYHLGKIVLL